MSNASSSNILLCKIFNHDGLGLSSIDEIQDDIDQLRMPKLNCSAKQSCPFVIGVFQEDLQWIISTE
jgi:hypothetical protein